jgi:hypothetical protein
LKNNSVPEKTRLLSPLPIEDGNDFTSPYTDYAYRYSQATDGEQAEKAQRV